MKKVTLALFMGLCLCVSLATAQVNEAAPAESVPSNGSPDYIGDLLYSVDVETPTGDVRMLGFCDDGSHFWCTGANDMITAYLYEFDENWNLLNSFVTGHTSWAWRDLCFDGAFLYASDSGVIDQIDRTTGMGTGVTIPSPVIPARAMAYDPDLDCFWTASWSSDLYQVFRDGSYNSFANILTGVYGMAWDGRDPVAPMLWIWSQDGSGAQATQFDPLTGTFTGVTWDGDATLGIAGGADLFTDPANGTVLGGMHQGSPDVVAVYHMEDAPPMIPPTMDLKVNGGDTGVIVPEGANAPFTLDIAANQNLGDDVDIFIGVHKSGRFFAHDGTDFVPWAPGDAGVYFSGQLADMSATVYDLPVPLGNYKLKAIIDTNILGTIYGARVAIAGMRSQGFGAIYNLEGLGSAGRHVPGTSLYATTKAAVRYFTDALILETKGTPLVVGAIRPGMVMTDLVLEGLDRESPDWPRAERIFNILADRVETVTPWIARRVVENDRAGVRIDWLTRRRVFSRFLLAPFRSRNVFD